MSMHAVAMVRFSGCVNDRAVGDEPAAPGAMGAGGGAILSLCAGRRSLHVVAVHGF